MMNLAVTIGIMGGATALILKCQDEAFATPTKEGMAASVRMARQTETLLGDLRTPYCDEVKEEERILELEVRALMEKCRITSGNDWDPDEFYFVYDELKQHFPGLTFEPLSFCAGLLTLTN